MTCSQRSPASTFVILSALVCACADEGDAADGDDPSSGTAPVDTSGTPSTEGSSGQDSTGGEVPLLDDYALDGDMLFPEGVTFDAETRAFYVGSLADGGVYRIDADGMQSQLAQPAAGMWSTAGMKIDAQARRLWVCATEAAGDARIDTYQLDDGALLQSFELATLVEGASCNDLALDADGRAYVTDPPTGAIHRVTSDGTGELWAMDPLLAPELGTLGVNGIAVTPDDTAIVVAKYSPPRLLRIATGDATAIDEIALDGDDFAGGSPLAGADGIVFLDDALFVVFDDVVKRVELAADGLSGEVTTVSVPGVDGGLSTATVAEARLYVVKSEVQAFVLGGAPELPFRIVHVPLP